MKALLPRRSPLSGFPLSEGQIDRLARAVFEAYRVAGIVLATAESCTGGMIAAALTDIAGSSAIFDRGFVTYSNAAKTDMLGVDAALIGRVGAVSPEVAGAMAVGVLARSQASVAVSVTGIAGPGGGSAEKPVGLVWFGLATAKGATTESQVFQGDRGSVRQQAAEHALNLFLAGLERL
jgi:nicotinamide-nucleotide amidase